MSKSRPRVVCLTIQMKRILYLATYPRSSFPMLSQSVRGPRMGTRPLQPAPAPELAPAPCSPRKTGVTRLAQSAQSERSSQRHPVCTQDLSAVGALNRGGKCHTQSRLFVKSMFAFPMLLNMDENGDATGSPPRRSPEKSGVMPDPDPEPDDPMFPRSKAG